MYYDERMYYERNDSATSPVYLLSKLRSSENVTALRKVIRSGERDGNVKRICVMNGDSMFDVKWLTHLVRACTVCRGEKLNAY